MKVRAILFASVCVLAGAGAGVAVVATQPEGDHPGKRYVEEFKARASGENAMAAYMEASKPGAAHEFLALFAGEFDVTSKMWMDPSAPPMESTARATSEMIMGGRYLKMHYAGDLMGMSFTGMGTTGYDNTRNLFVGTWIDSMSTGISLASGNLDQTGTVLTLVGTMDDPATGEHGKAYKQVLRWIDHDTHIFEMWEILYGEPFKVMELTYTRIK